MASFSVAGKVQLNGRTLTLQLPEEEPELKVYRSKSDALMEDIKAGKIQVHPSRQPMNKKKLSNAMNNVQRMLLLKGGAEGEWNPRAQMRLESLLPKPIVVKKVKLPIGDHQPDAKDAPLALEDGNPNSSSDSSSDSDSSSSSSEEDAPMENSCDSSDKDKHIAKLQEDFESIFAALHATQKDLFSAQKQLSDARAVIEEQRSKISNLKRTIQTLENQILSDAGMTSD